MHKMPLIEGLNDIVNRDIISFHVPGHKKGNIFKKLGYLEYVQKIVDIDTTEIPGTDNLHNPEDIIQKSQQMVSEAFKSDYSFYLVNGSTCGIYAAIMAVCDPRDAMLVNRDCHQSVINASVLGDITPIYINPSIDLNLGISKGITKDEIKKAIKENENIKAVLITSPTYYGVCVDVKEIAEYVHSKGKVLIVDEAHGSHLGLSDKLPKSSLELGADIVIQSIHKTLPAFTQSSILHVKGNNVDIEKLRLFLRLFQSSSPSYILMSSLEMAVNIYKEHGQNLMNELIKNINELKDFMKTLKNINIFESNNLQDTTKIYILTKKLNKSGYEVEVILREQYNIQVELSNPYGILLVCSIGNEKSDFEKLKIALKEIDKNKENKKEEHKFYYPNKLPNQILKPRDAFYSNKKDIKIEESIGKICGEYIIPYPPGISILSPGEEITKEIIDYIINCKQLGMNITGMKDNSLEYIQIID